MKIKTVTMYSIVFIIYEESDYLFILLNAYNIYPHCNDKIDDVLIS